jgi:polyisoprenoid-binding protein YceI
MSITVLPFTGAYTADPDHSSFQAELRHMGVGTFRTGFEDVQARLETTADGGSRLTGRARVESITIRRPAEFRAHVVEGKEFFDASNHPELRFASEAIEFADGGRVAIMGTLTMRGIERPVAIGGSYREPVEDIYGATRMALDLATTIDRRDWGFDFQAQLPRGGDVLSWDVGISVHLELVADPC